MKTSDAISYAKLECLDHAHTINSEIEASRLPVHDCGTIYHLDCDGQRARVKS